MPLTKGQKMQTYLTTAEAARRLGLTPASVRLMARRGDLPIAVQTATGVRLFGADAVETLRRARGRARSRHPSDIHQGA